MNRAAPPTGPPAFEREGDIDFLMWQVERTSPQFQLDAVDPRETTANPWWRARVRGGFGEE